jgi:hemerythrin-like domain-containing protein
MTSTARLDSFTPIHKALRRLFFEAAVQLARTDFAAPDEVEAAARSVAECLTWLREHAEHEDREVLPVIARLDAQLAAELSLEHPELERLAIDVDSLWPRLAALDVPGARAQMGAELLRRFQALIAAQLRHMDREEREVNALLWANLGDREIAQISQRIVAAIPPDRLRHLGAIIDASLSRPEREQAAAARRAA